jgi:hypothetical protein
MLIMERSVRIAKLAFLPTVVATVSLMGSIMNAQAVPLAHDARVTTSGTTEENRPELKGDIIEDKDRPFTITDRSGNIVAKGILQDRVVREKTGSLDFYYKIVNDPSSGNSIIRVEKKDFKNYSTDVDYRTDGEGSVGSSEAARSKNGHDITFMYNRENPIKPGDQSYFTYVKTDADSYKRTGLTIIYAETPGKKARKSDKAEIKTFEPSAHEVR